MVVCHAGTAVWAGVHLRFLGSCSGGVGVGLLDSGFEEVGWLEEDGGEDAGA